MNTGFFVVFGIIAVFCVLHYLLFITRRTILRKFGRAAVFFAVGFIFIYPRLRSRSPDSVIYSVVNSIEIINDMQTLIEATFLFHEDFKTWPLLPEQGASLDAYCYRRIVLVKPPRYAKVTLTHKSGDADGTQEHYIGVELIPKRNGTTGIQENLARNARNTGLLQQPISGDIYKSGLSVYMQLQ
jgi:hypothetical protein